MLKLKAKLKLDDIVYSPNIAESLDEEDLRKIAADVRETYTRDKESRMEWEHDTKQVIKLAKMIAGPKDTPYPGSSNIKYALISTAVLQYAARAYPEIVRNGRVVEMAATGRDPDGAKHRRAARCADAMNYQTLVESQEWEDSTDKLLHTLPLIGVAYKKTYYDPIRKVSISELCPYDEIFVNASIKSIESARAITHQIKMHRNTILEKIRYGHYIEVDKEKLERGAELEDQDQGEHYVLEQHRYLDLDGDGYEEPYIVTTLDSSEEVLRIIARFDPDKVEYNSKDEVQCIHPIHYFTDFHCIPNPDGSFYSLGLGHLLFGSNEILNTVLNLQMDAGRFANMQTGIADKKLRIKGGEIPVVPGKIMSVDTAQIGPLKDLIHMFEFKDPSPVLLQLFQVILGGAKELASINDANMGQEQVQNVAQKVIASQMEAGAKLASGMQRRLFRGLKKEFEKLFRLNRIFLTPEKYAMILDDPEADPGKDFEEESMDVRPVADPNMSSDQQRMARTDAIMQMIQIPQMTQHFNTFDVAKDAMENLRVPNIEAILIPPQPDRQSPEDIDMQSQIAEREAKVKLEEMNHKLKEADQIIKAHLAEAEIAKMESEAELNRAKAQQEGEYAKLEQYKQDMGVIMASHKGEVEIEKENIKAKARASAKPKEGK